MNRVCGPLYLRQVRQRTGMPLAFGGQVTDRVPRLSEFLGAQTNTLRGLNEIPGDRPGRVRRRAPAHRGHVGFLSGEHDRGLLLSPRSFCHLP